MYAFDTANHRLIWLHVQFVHAKKSLQKCYAGQPRMLMMDQKQGE